MLPSALNRASAPKVSGARLVPDGLLVMFSPPTSIFPSGWIRTVWAPCTLALNIGKVVVARPPAPNSTPSCRPAVSPPPVSGAAVGYAGAAECVGGGGVAELEACAELDAWAELEACAEFEACAELDAWAELDA